MAANTGQQVCKLQFTGRGAVNVKALHQHVAPVRKMQHKQRKLTCTKNSTPKPPVAAQAAAAVKSVVLGLKVRGSIYMRPQA